MNIKNAAVFGLLMLPMMACERRTIVRLEGGNSPTFVLSGSGRLGQVLIFAPEQERIAESNPFDKTYTLWEIATEGEGESAAIPLEDLHSITYGIVPKGYRQTKPESGPPPPLTPGKRYSYWFVTVNSPWGAGYFEIREGKAIAVQGP